MKSNTCITTVRNAVVDLRIKLFLEEMDVDEAQTQRILAVKRLVKERNEARANCDYERSDFLREKLVNEYGVTLIDQNGGPSGWKFLDNSSKKLKQGVNIAAIEKTTQITGKKRQSESNASSETLLPTAQQKKSRKGISDDHSQKIFDLKLSDIILDTAGNKSIDGANITGSKSTSFEQKRNTEVLKSLLETSSNSSNVHGVLIDDLKIGSGPIATNGNRVAVNYIGKLKSNGKVFDASKKKPFVFRLGKGEVIKGWDIGVSGMAVGGVRRLTIPPEKAYGKQGSPPVIPSNATLVFDVTLCKVL